MVPAHPDDAALPSAGGPGAVAPYYDYPPSPPYQDDEEEETSNTAAKIRRYLAAIKRFKWLIAILVILGTGAGVFATRFVQPSYEAHSAVWISDVNPGGGGNALRGPELLPNGSWVELFRSFSVVDRVVDKLHLWYTPKHWQDSASLVGLHPTANTQPGEYALTIDPSARTYTLSEIKRGVVDRGVLGDSIGRQVGFAWFPDTVALKQRGTISFWVAQPRAVAVGLINRVEIVMQEQSNFLKLTLTGTDKWKTAKLLNTWMEEFVNKAVELRRRNMGEVASILETQRAAAAAGLAQAEAALQTFRTNSITQPGEGTGISSATAGSGYTGDPLAANFFRNQGDYDNVRRDRLALDSIATAGRNGGLIPDAVLTVPSVAQTPALSAAVKELIDKEAQLRTMRLSYTDSYKPVQELAAAVVTLRTQTIPQLASDASSALRRRESELLTSIRSDSVKLRGIPQRSIEEARLRRNLSVAEGLYTTVENKYEATRLGASTTVPDVSILDPALPSSAPQRNMQLILIIGGFAASLGFGIALALLLDMVDHRFRYQEQITDELKLKVVGAVPAVPKAADALNDPEAMLQSIEAFRSLRMYIHHSYDTPPVMLTITSPGAGDGKSMVASNLALSFAEAGYRTLLIDGDIRRGKLHNVLNVDRRPGLLDYLAGEADISAITRDIPTSARLTVIPSGTRRHRGPELLTSARLPALFNTMRTRYDVILVDSAPLGAGIDSYALGVATGNMVLVMRTGVTDRRIAKAKLKVVERFPIRMLGAIVNDVPAKGLYHEYSYLYGYAPDVDPDAAGKEIPVLRAAESSK